MLTRLLPKTPSPYSSQFDKILLLITEKPNSQPLRSLFLSLQTVVWEKFIKNWPDGRRTDRGGGFRDKIGLVAVELKECSDETNLNKDTKLEVTEVRRVYYEESNSVKTWEVPIHGWRRIKGQPWSGTRNMYWRNIISIDTHVHAQTEELTFVELPFLLLRSRTDTHRHGSHHPVTL